MKSSEPSPRSEWIAAHYERLLASRRRHHEILDWASAESQHRRFDVLIEEVDLEGRSLLDVGCGLGDLLTHLRNGGIEVDYTGVDLLERMVAAAKKRNPSGQFVQADLFTANPFPPRSFDVVFCSGTLNLNLGNNMAFLPRAIRTFTDLAGATAVVNLLRDTGQPCEPTYFCYPMRRVERILGEMGLRFRTVTGYLPNDFTVVVDGESEA